MANFFKGLIRFCFYITVLNSGQPPPFHFIFLAIFLTILSHLLSQGERQNSPFSPKICLGTLPTFEMAVNKKFPFFENSHKFIDIPFPFG